MTQVSRIDESSKGVYIISATPFSDDGSLDLESADSLVEFYLEKGVNGIIILDMMGEAPTLNEEESFAFTHRVLKRTAGRVPVIVGMNHASNRHIERLAGAAMELGAAGIMLAPVSNLKSDDHVYGYYAAVAHMLGRDIPICIQDAPQPTGVHISVAVVHELVDDFPQVVMFKHEELPGMRKLSQLRTESVTVGRRHISILTGNNGLFLPQEMARGADGVTTGFAYPEMLVQVCDLCSQKKPEVAEDLFDIYLPLLRHESQYGIGLALRKEILYHRGAIRSASVRKPGSRLDATDKAELYRLVSRLHTRLAMRVARGGSLSPGRHSRTGI